MNSGVIIGFLLGLVGALIVAPYVASLLPLSRDGALVFCAACGFIFTQIGMFSGDRWLRNDSR